MPRKRSNKQSAFEHVVARSILEDARVLAPDGDTSIRKSYKEAKRLFTEQRLMVISKEQMVWGNATDGIRRKGDFNERFSQADSDATCNEAVDPQEGFMDLHEGAYCIVNPAYYPMEASDTNQSDLMLEALDAVIKLMYAVAAEAI